MLGLKCALNEVKYIKDDGTTNIWASSNYHADLDSYPMRVQFEDLPTSVDDRVHAVEIAGRAGYSTVPSAQRVPCCSSLAICMSTGRMSWWAFSQLLWCMEPSTLMDKFKPSTF